MEIKPNTISILSLEYRGWNQSLTIDLSRGAYNPDLYPDFRVHSMSIWVGREREDSCENYVQEGFLNWIKSDRCKRLFDKQEEE